MELLYVKTLSHRMGIHLLRFNPSKYTVDDIIFQLKQTDLVSIVQPNHTNIQKRATVPNDLEYPVQWSLGFDETARIYAPQAWDLTTDGVTLTGDTIVMAVVDGGMDLNHIDLNLFKNKHEIPNNGIDDDNNGYIDDYDGWNANKSNGQIGDDSHGTHVGGILGAKSNNNEGIAGIVWGGLILPVEGLFDMESEVLEAYGYVLELRSKYNETDGDSGAFVVASNSSFGLDFQTPADYPLWCEFYDSLGMAGVLSLTATTNSGADVDSLGDIPTTCPSNYMVAVSNINQNGNLIGGYGATSIDLAAPGTDIRSTTPNHSYGYKSGTSMATPHVTGVVGAMYSAMCGFDIDDALTRPDSLTLWMRQKLLESVDTVSNLNGFNSTSGRLNMFKAVKSVQPRGIELTYDRTPASNSSTPDGEIILYAISNAPSLNYIWNTGATTSTLTNLFPGTYSVTVTEDLGCENTETIDIWTVNTEEITRLKTFTLWPNPSNGNFEISFMAPLENRQILKVYDNVGKMVYSSEVQPLTKTLAIKTELKRGTYFIQIGNGAPQGLVIN